MNQDKKERNEDQPVLQILKQIKDGSFDYQRLDKEMRQACVEHLWYVEAQPVATIALLLKVSDKTIRRDQDEIRKRNAERPSADYTVKVFGELLEKATAAHENMMRLSRSTDASVQEKSQAGYYAWKMIQEQIKIAQSLGVVPSEAMRTVANVREPEEAPHQLKEELARLENIIQDRPIDPKTKELIETIKAQISLAEAKVGIKELRSRIENQMKQGGKDER